MEKGPLAEELALRGAGGNLHLAARAHGPPDGVAVLALHGWLDNAASFDALAAHLAGIRLVCLDLPGHGYSDHRPPGCAYHLIDFVGDVLAATDSLGWQRFTVLGHSLGGVIGTLVAGACPERVERLSLVEALGPFSEAPEHAPARLAAAVARGRQGMRRAAPVYSDLDAAVAARSHAGGLSYGAARTLVERGTYTSDDGVCWRSDPRLRWPSAYRLTEKQVLAFLRAVRAPTQVVVADDGLLKLDAPPMSDRFAALPNATADQLAGHHHLHMETPLRVAERLAPFLRGEHRRAFE